MSRETEHGNSRYINLEIPRRHATDSDLDPDAVKVYKARALEVDTIQRKIF
jgi:hypothetical protein